MTSPRPTPPIERDRAVFPTVLCVLGLCLFGLGMVARRWSAGGPEGRLEACRQPAALQGFDELIRRSRPASPGGAQPVRFLASEESFSGLPAPVRGLEPSYLEVGRNYVLVEWFTFLGRVDTAVLVRRNEADGQLDCALTSVAQ